MMELKNENVRATFEKLENGRAISNCISFFVDGRDYGHAYVTREFGNWWFKFWKENLFRLSEDEIDRFYLRLCIYQDNYDSYSDISKDMFGFRMRKTSAEWDRMVREERRIYH